MRKDGKKLALEFLSQKGRLKGNTLVFRCIESCFKGRSSSFFFPYTYYKQDRNSEFQLQLRKV